MSFPIIDSPASKVAKSAWQTARAAGASAPEAAQEAWLAVRTVNKHLRAPFWGEAFAMNRANGRKSYRCPLAQAILADPSHFEDYGSHAGKWRRTQKSVAECSARVAEALTTLVAAWG